MTEPRKYEWAAMPHIVQTGNEPPIRTGTIKLAECPRPGDYILVGENDELQVNKVLHREGKPTLLKC